MMDHAKTSPALPTPWVPISWGELIDKLTILEIKNERMTDKAAIANVRKELVLLRRMAAPALTYDEATRTLATQLKTLNETLWDIEERIRAKEIAVQFGTEFIELARSVYKRNDERGDLKRKINLRLKSELMEEKNYKRPVP